MKIKFSIPNIQRYRSLGKAFENKNRIYIIAFFFVIFFLIIIKQLFSYTVLNYGFYKGLADHQQIGEVIVPVTRGTLYSANNNGTILGTSLNLYDIAIDPQIEGDILKLENFLVEVVYKQVCDLASEEDCYNNMLKFLHVLDLEEFEQDEVYIKGLITKTLDEKLRQTKVTSVLIDRELDNEKLTKIAHLGLPGIYTNFPYVYVNPEEIIESSVVAKRLSSIIGIEEERLEYLIRKRDLRYIPIINKLSIGVSEFVKNYIKEEQLALKKGLLLKENSIGGFIILTPKPQRYYPEKEVASQLIGFVSTDGVGHYGLEGFFNDILKGNNGKIVSKKDILGRIINPIDLDVEDFVSEGINIHTTIDRNIQKKVENILEMGVKKFKANKGTIIVMEPKTGRILSMANYPTYNLNNHSDIYELEKVRFTKYPDPKIDLLGMPVFVEDNENGQAYIYDGKEILLRESTREELGDSILVKYKYKNDFGPEVYKNDAISSLYEPGSIMKAITVAIGIDTGEIDSNSMYLDEGKLTIDNFTIENVSKQCLGYNTFGNALNFSCNVGMIRIAQKVGKVLFQQYLKDFGFSELTGITLEGEVTATIHPWERWSKAQLYTSSYGLGVSTTPLQMANAYSIIANGGVYIKPRIVDSIEFADGRVIKYKTELNRRVIKESTSKLLTSMLVSSVNDGVAKIGGVEGYTLAGKTGTSQIPYKGSYETGIGSTIGSYAGFGPAEDPKFVVIVKLDRPRLSEFGGSTSAYLFQETVKYLFNYFEVPKKETKKEAQ